MLELKLLHELEQRRILQITADRTACLDNAWVARLLCSVGAATL